MNEGHHQQFKIGDWLLYRYYSLWYLDLGVYNICIRNCESYTWKISDNEPENLCTKIQYNEYCQIDFHACIQLFQPCWASSVQCSTPSWPVAPWILSLKCVQLGKHKAIISNRFKYKRQKADLERCSYGVYMILVPSHIFCSSVCFQYNTWFHFHVSHRTQTKEQKRGRPGNEAIRFVPGCNCIQLFCISNPPAVESQLS